MAKRFRRMLTTLSAEIRPGFVATEYRATLPPAGPEVMAGRFAARHGVDRAAVTVTSQPEPKVSYRWRPGRGTATKEERGNRTAEQYARWLAARDGIELPAGKMVRVEWSGIYSEHRAGWQKRARAVEWGHKEEIYNYRKDGSRGAWLRNEFVADLRIDLPNWDFDPAEPVEEILDREPVARDWLNVAA